MNDAEPSDAVTRLLSDLAVIREPVAVIGERPVALGLALAQRSIPLRWWCDSRAAGLELTARLGGEVAAGAAGLAAALAGARTVLWPLPKATEQIRNVASSIARCASPDVAVYAGARIKYLQPSVNAALEESFGQVTVSLARNKSRVLTARSPIAKEGERPLARRFHSDLGLWVLAAGGVFAGTGIDIGTRFLASFLPQMNPAALTAVDLGCGSGVLAVLLARSRPGLRVVAADDSAMAITSAAATAAANGVRIETAWDDAGQSLPASQAGLIVLNPPFHAGGPVDLSLARHLIKGAGRLLAPGGELWTVYNSPLRYRPLLAAIGPTEQMGRNAKFTVTRTRRPQ